MPTSEKPVSEKAERNETPSNSFRDLVELAEFEVDRAKNALNAADQGMKKRIQGIVDQKAAVARKLRTFQRHDRLNTVTEDLRDKLADALQKRSPDSAAEISDTLDFLDRNRQDDLDSVPGYQAWLKAKQQKEEADRLRRMRERQEREKSASVAQVEEIKKAIHAAPNQPILTVPWEWPEDASKKQQTQTVPQHEQRRPATSERERQRERMIQAVMRDGGFRASMTFPKEVSPTGSAGSQTAYERLPSKYNLGSDLFDKTKERGVDESVDFTEVPIPVMEQVNLPAQKNWVGQVKVPARTEMRHTGQYRPMLHNELVTNGKNEPMVQVSYAVSTHSLSNNLQWREESGRTGQQLKLDIMLPKSAAKELQKALQSDPGLIRQIAEQVMKEKILGPTKVEAWTRAYQENAEPLRPPYERMKPQIYIQPMEESMANGFKWHDEYLHPV